MIYDKLLRAAKQNLQAIEENTKAPLSDPENPWYHDYNNLKRAIDELENELSRKAYFEVVAGAADDLLANLDPNDEITLEQQFMYQIHQLENEHPWVVDDEKAQLVLQYSNYPCQEPASFGQSGCLNMISGSDDFPWGPLAALALVEDVKEHLRDTYDLDVINEESLENIRSK